MKKKEFKTIKYAEVFPSGFDAGKKYPTIIYLHGAGTRGEDFSCIENNPYFGCVSKHKDFPFITYAPQCYADSWFDIFETLEEFVKYVIGLDYTDSSRIYLTGASMGGYGTWQLAMTMPECFAALVPICGGGMYWNAERLKNIPVWAFHGAWDNDVFPEESFKMVNSVNSHGGNAKLTIYPATMHDSWTATYSNYEVFEWLLKHTKACTKVDSNGMDDPGLFG